MDIAAAVVSEAVNARGRTVIAGGPERKIFGMLGVFLQAEDMNPAGCGLIVFGCGAVQEFQAVAVGDDHQFFADLDFGGGHIGMLHRVHDRHVLDVAGVGGVGHINDLNTVTEETAAVEIIFAVLRLIKLRLEKVVVISVVVTDDLHVLDITFIAGTLGIKLFAHRHSFLSKLYDGLRTWGFWSDNTVFLQNYYKQL